MSLLGLMRRFCRRAADFGRRRDGVSAVEFSFLAFPFAFLLFAILETGYIFLVAIVLQGATADAARQIRTGAVRGNAAGFETAVCNGIFFDANDYTTFTAIPAPSSPPATKGTPFNNGTSGDIVVVRVAIQWTYMTPFLESMLDAGLKGAKDMMATAVILNE